MKGIFDGLTKWIFVFLALGAGFVFVLKTFLNPPRASTPDSPQPVLSPTEDSQVNNPVEVKNLPESGQQNESNNLDNSNNNQSPLSENNLPTEPELIRNTQPEKNNIPTNKQPEEYVLEIPPKLEEGAELKVYLNNDESDNPNPANYSPSQIIKTLNIALTPGEKEDVFQESTGYFRVPKSGEYNFLIEHSSEYYSYFDEGRLVGRVDGEPLGNPRGGRVKLDEGWHRFDLFYNPQNYARRINEQEITVKMALPGEVAEKIEIWREAEDKNTAQKLETKQTK